jgi:pilus assembly protein Flp/PilA
MRMKVNGRQLNAGISSLIRFLRDEEGQNLIEYALIAGLIGLAAVVSLTSVRTSVASVFNKLGNVLTNAL